MKILKFIAGTIMAIGGIVNFLHPNLAGLHTIEIYGLVSLCFGVSFMIGENN